MSSSLSQADAALDALGPVPAELRALVARYAGDDFALAQVDRALEALGQGVEHANREDVPALPSAAMASHTVVGLEVPAGEPSTQAAAELASVEWAMDMPPRPEVTQPAPPALSFDLNAAEPEADERSFPWDSVPPDERRSPPARNDARTAPPQPRAEIGLASAGPPSAAAPAEPDRRRDTLEDGPIVSPALELESGAGTAQAELPELPDLPASDAAADGDAATDEFEIMVDDDLLEIAEDDLEIVEDDK